MLTQRDRPGNNLSQVFHCVTLFRKCVSIRWFMSTGCKFMTVGVFHGYDLILISYCVAWSHLKVLGKSAYFVSEIAGDRDSDDK